MIRHSQSTQSNKFAVSLQYLKKKVRDEIHFCHADKQQRFYNWHYCFNRSGQTCTKYPK